MPHKIVTTPVSLPLQELVDDLYNFRDCYFETHSEEEAGNKQSDVAQEIENTLKKLEEKESEHCIRTTVHSLLVFVECHSHLPCLCMSHRSVQAQSRVYAAEGPVSERRP